MKGLLLKFFGMLMAFGAVFLSGKSAGKHKERAKASEAKAKQAVEANEIERVVRESGPGDARKRLRERANKRVRRIQRNRT